MAGHGLESRDRHVGGTGTEQGMNGPRLGAVVQERGRAVSAEEVHIPGSNVRVAQRCLHERHQGAAAFIQLHHGVGIAIAGIAGQPGISGGATGGSVAGPLQHQNGSPLTQHEAIPVALEGPAGCGRIVIA